MTIPLKRPPGRDPNVVEVERIVGLPLVEVMDSEEVECFSYEHMLAPAFDRGERFFPEQASAIKAYMDNGGLLAPIGVGWGKSGICLVVANHAYVSGLRTTLLLVPAANFASVAMRHIPEWRRRVPLSVPFHFLGKRGLKQRKAIAESGAPGCYVLPYSLANKPDTLDMLDAIRPELIIADEVQNLKNPRAGTTKKIMEWHRMHSPQFVGMSGTITSKSIQDYHHLVTAALQEESPLPRSKSTAFMFGQVIDAKVQQPDGYGKKLMVPIVRWAEQNFPEEEFDFSEVETYRRAYAHRLNTAPGVVSTGGDANIGVSLSIINEEVPDPEKSKGWAQLMEHFDDLEERWVAPSGDEIEHAIHTFKWKYELSGGFYNQLVWPDAEHVMKHRDVDQAEAEQMIARAQEHHDELQRYRKLLRDFFDTAPLGLDTPLEVGRSIALYGDRDVWPELARQWRVVKDLQFEGMPKRLSVPVRVCPYKIDHAVRWAEERERGVLWVWHEELGRWLVEALAEAGMDPLHCPQGANEAIERVGDPEQGGKGDRIVVASLGAHGVGKNLQAFQHMLYVQWPRQAPMAEQSIGRIHRNGQQADHLDIHTNLTLEWDHMNRAACLNDAIYSQQSTETRQKVLTCDYDPLPQVFSPEFLREQGLTPKRLSAEAHKMLLENFGWRAPVA